MTAGGPGEKAGIRRALNDKEWPVRWRAAELLHGLGERTPVEHHAGVPLRRVSSKHKAGSSRSFHHEVRKLDGRGSQAYRHGSVQEV